ncbi:hypothetical protein KDH_26990 [Dictyobacter sp. S3.2.2.5]|uniref:Uncharacterized protein n=1 Tax=Dictyobacter halimunensis TaxID=3026934 RepID=A0ABQ6FRD0_9CHLR|nr:hypothetical protein KDH_26990 [Dictyobacter sp. S3.2.2.5]
MVTTRMRIGADNHKPFHLSKQPKFQLERMIGVLMQARIAHPQEVMIVRLPFGRVPRARFFLVFKSEQILENSHCRFLPCQASFPREEKISERDVAVVSQIQFRCMNA